MRLPLILEELYLETVAKRLFPSGPEDSKQISEELVEISSFFSEVSLRQRDAQVKDISDKRLLEILKAYQGPRTPRIRIRTSVVQASSH